MADPPTTPRLRPPVDPERDHVSGPPGAPVTLVEYGDYQCPFCRRAHHGIQRVRHQRVPGQVRYVYRHLPNRRVHEHAQLAAEAAEAAGVQQKFWEMHDRLFTTDEPLERAVLVRLATEIGLDVPRFERDLDEHVHADRIEEDLASAVASGAHATPTLYVDGRRYDGPWDAESLLDAIRKPLGWRLRMLAEQFAGLSISSGLLMLLGVAAALVWANSPWRESYHALWSTRLGVGVGVHSLDLTLEEWVNDGLIVIFFLVVALDIRQEITLGDLASPRRAALPIVSALGGMLTPALIYLGLNAGGPAAHGWGIPMGTDTAFALGVMAVLGPRVPLSLRVFVATVAIADDMGSISVIALFYTENVVWSSLLAGLLLWLLALSLSWSRVYRTLPYIVIGVALWLAVLDAGVHPTLAGVLLAFAIPTRSRPNTANLLDQTESLLQSVETPPVGEMDEARYPSLVRGLQEMVDRLFSPAQRLACRLQPWSAYVVLPLFAFANAGIELDVHARDFLQPVSLGVGLGLVFGKPIGISLGAWLATRLGIGTKPDDVRWPQLVGAGMLCGMGFTMAFFVAGLTFDDAQTLALTKESVMAASLIAGVAGSTTLALWYRRWRGRIEDAAQRTERAD